LGASETDSRTVGRERSKVVCGNRFLLNRPMPVAHGGQFGVPPLSWPQRFEPSGADTHANWKGDGQAAWPSLPSWWSS